MNIQRIQRGWMKRMAWPVGTFLFLAVIFLCSSVPALASSGPTATNQLKPFASRISGQRSLSRTATCSDNGCNGLDPYQTYCADSFYPAATKKSGNLLVELEYSRICQTNWTQGYWLDGSTLSLDVTIQRLAGVDGGFKFDSYWSDGSSWWANSNQLYAPHNKAIACVYTAPSVLDPGLCTPAT